MANKTLKLKRQTGFASVSAATTALQAAFANGTFAAGEPALGILTDGSVVLGIQGDATHGSVFYNAATVEAAIAQAINDLKGDAEKYLTLGALEDAIDELSGNTAGYSITEVTENVPAEVKKRYQLTKTVGSTSTKEGEYIDIYKDSSIVSIDYDSTTQELVYTYINASGSTVETRIDLSELVLEAEAGSGITATNHILHGVVDPASEGFFSVGASGFLLTGVQDAIDTAADAATTVVAEGTDAGNNMSIVETAGADGHKIFTINLSDVASASGLTTEVTARRAQTGISGDVYTPNAGTIISGATSLNNADVILAGKVAELEAAQISIEKGAGSESFLDIQLDNTTYKITVSGITDTINTSISGAVETLDAEEVGGTGKYLTTISEANGIITASAADLVASAVGATPITAGNDTVAVTGTTVEAQISSLGKTAKDIQDAAYSGVTSANAAINAGAVTNNGQVLTFQLDTTTASNNITSDMLDLTDNGLRMKDTFDCGTWS